MITIENSFVNSANIEYNGPIAIENSFVNGANIKYNVLVSFALQDKNHLSFHITEFNYVCFYVTLVLIMYLIKCLIILHVFKEIFFN